MNGTGHNNGQGPAAGAAGCGCISPRRQGLKQVNGTGHNNGQGPAATT
ncbi:hypothetical protein [Escherichia coli]|nr:hypothetical protein [Escherichia coli]